MKTCKTCGETKDILEFYRRKDSPDGWRNDCKKCSLKKAERNYMADYKRQRINKKAWYLGKGRNKNILKLYNLSKEQYDAMFDLQDGRCAICFDRPKIYLSVDHDHKTGKIRELICKPCNLGLGIFNDDYDRISLASKYLLKHNNLKKSAPSLKTGKEIICQAKNQS